MGVRTVSEKEECKWVGVSMKRVSEKEEYKWVGGECEES